MAFWLFFYRLLSELWQAMMPIKIKKTHLLSISEFINYLILDPTCEPVFILNLR